MKRSNKPIFWSLFGAGGMLSALIGAMLIFITGLGIPLGIGLPQEAMTYSQVLALAQNFFGKVAILAVISLFLFHGCHRLYHGLHDLGVHVGPGIKAAFHGFAALGSLATLVLLIRIGFSA
ncbi:MAG: fumarate reductase [Candidatus Muproteobacteria bacterium RBG_16_60_9]|uniref:Fumarate reductase n=1 Tax=Candidatus Muproteobacteria bacterium RBG_16_60_9 TaxID=1817755 RepID=A0A1F6UWS3_9PROT|nr:MAG: fumarate reductase [Candidatus Muproteobacteria bacterium RBG_16_60_9]